MSVLTVHTRRPRRPSSVTHQHQPTGSVALIHPETHFTDEKAGLLRSATYRRLRRHWQFINELSLFEVHHLVSYGVHIYAGESDPDFRQATSLYHPDTVGRSLKHDGSGTEPGLKDDDGKWDLRPHAARIQRVDLTTLGTWHAVLESEDVPVGQSRMVYTVNRSTAAVLDKLSEAPRIGSLGLQFSRGWDESIDRKKGYFDSEWGVPESWDSVILQGPHLFVSTPFYKTPNPSMLHKLDWSPTDFEVLPSNAIPATSYKPRGDRARYQSMFTHWVTQTGSEPATRFYRVAWRSMWAAGNERSLIPALLPPGATHVHAVGSAGMPGRPLSDLVSLLGFMSSLLLDASIRVVPKSTIPPATLNRLPYDLEPDLASALVLRVLRLNVVTDAYADLWSGCFDASFQDDDWTSVDDRQIVGLGDVTPTWTPSTLLRRAIDRRQAQVEIDALVAIMTGVSAEELCALYRTQFPVLAGYDRGPSVYDANGRLVPTAVSNCAKKGHTVPAELRTAAHPGSGVAYVYDPPFRTLDREADMQAAYAEFERRRTATA